MAWRLANSLVKIRDQVNAAYPNRSKAADGGIGDVAHQAQGSASDHNPWLKDGSGTGVVTAYDITHDPANGVDIDKLSDELIASRDPRIKYVIANGLIAGPYTNWQWQQSSGHYNHIHISVNTNNYDNESNWNIGDDMPIPDADNYFGRYNKAMHFIRGRTMSRTEFRKNFVGNTDLRMLEAMLDDPEAERFTLDGELGRKARKDNWEGQIHSLNAKVKALSTRPTEAQLNQLNKQIESLVKSADSATAERDKLKDQMSKDEEAGRSFFRQVADWLRTLGIK